MSVLDPTSARAMLLGFVVTADQSIGPPSNCELEAQLARQAPTSPAWPWASTDPRSRRIRVAYALAWLRRSGMVRCVDPYRRAWEPTEYGRAVLRSMLAETENHGGGN